MFRDENVGGGDRVRALDPRAQPVLFEQLCEHDGGSFIQRTAAGNAEHRRIGLPLGRKVLLSKERELRARIIRRFKRRRGLGVVRRFARRLSIVLIDQIVDKLDNGRFDLFALRAIERSPRDVLLGKLQTRQGDFVIVR